MKKFILALSVLMTVPAFADSAKTVVGSFNGKLTIETESLDIKKVDVEIVNQFCNFWGTTCSGGPQDTELLPIITTEIDNGKSIMFTNESKAELSSSKFGNRFSSCKINLLVEAVNAEGKNVTGLKDLAFFNDKKVCASKVKITDAVRESLAKPLIVKDGGFYLSIQ